MSYYQERHALHGVPIQTVGYNPLVNPYANVQFSTSAPAFPRVVPSTPTTRRVPSCSARAAFRSTPPAAAAATASAPAPAARGKLTSNLSQMLPKQLRSSSSVASSSVSSQAVTNKWSRTPTSQSRRNSTTTSVVGIQHGIPIMPASRSRTPEIGESQPATSSKVQKANEGQKVTTAKNKVSTKHDKIYAIHKKGDKVGKLSNSVWYKAPKNGKIPVRKPAQNPQRPAAAKKQKSVRRKATNQTARFQQQYACASPEVVKALRKLRKKVRQCNNIQKKLDQGFKVEEDELTKLKQVNDFKQQITVLERQVSTGKAVDLQGFQKVTGKSRRRC